MTVEYIEMPEGPPPNPYTGLQAQMHECYLASRDKCIEMHKRQKAEMDAFIEEFKQALPLWEKGTVLKAKIPGDDFSPKPIVAHTYDYWFSSTYGITHFYVTMHAWTLSKDRGEVDSQIQPVVAGYRWDGPVGATEDEFRRPWVFEVDEDQSHPPLPKDEEDFLHNFFCKPGEKLVRL